MGKTHPAGNLFFLLEAARSVFNMKVLGEVPYTPGGDVLLLIMTEESRLGFSIRLE